MKNKKLFFILISVLIIIVIILFFIIKNFNQKSTSDEESNYSDYTPEEEISSEQLRETIVTLFFLDSTSGDLKSESKIVDSAVLLQNPYKTLIELLLKGPQGENLTNVFPDGTVILDATFEKNCAKLNFSQELLNFKDETQKYNIINCLLNTLTQLKEVDSIQILVNDTIPSNFEKQYNLKNPLTKSE